jgi:hypothetical protein
MLAGVIPGQRAKRPFTAAQKTLQDNFLAVVRIHARGMVCHIHDL